MLILPSAVEVCYLCVCVYMCVFSFSPAPPPPFFLGFPVVLFCFLNVLLFWLFEVIGSLWVWLCLAGKYNATWWRGETFPLVSCSEPRPFCLPCFLYQSRGSSYISMPTSGTCCVNPTCWFVPLLFCFLCVLLGDLFNFVCFNDDFWT